MQRFLTGFLLAVAAVAVSGIAAAADKQTFLGQSGDWYAYRLVENGQRTCYMVSKPKRMRGKYKKRGDVVVFVTHRPKENERDVVNFQSGYPHKKKSTVSVKIGDKKFSLFTSNDTAWARDPAADKTMVAAMVKGSTMVVNGTSVRGTKTVDTYSLRGFSKSYKRISRACGIK
jgi:hypothetical protein